MLYEISMNITYVYDIPAAGGRQRLYLAPKSIPDVQTVNHFSIEVSPKPSEIFTSHDFFGNDVHSIAFRESHSKISFQMNCEVMREPQKFNHSKSPDLRSMDKLLANQTEISALSPWHFAGASPRLRHVSEIEAYAKALVQPDMPVLDVVTHINQSLHRDLTFNSHATDVHTPVEVAFENKHGVCQDFSHIMIACLRSIGVPAGYVSGFLRTFPPPGKPRLEGADAMHAWVRAWLGPDIGWVELDPTNNIFAGEDHIITAYGRDYSDVAPVKGVLRIAGVQSSSHSVDVRPLEVSAN